jgi:voltage-gated potassium channel
MILIERRIARALRQPVSVRNAMGVLVVAMLVTVVAGGALIRLLDPKDFPDIGVGMWWALQTATTVGYGDVTPTNGVGRIVGAVVMLESIAFLSVITAAVTSSFVERSRQLHYAQEMAEDAADNEYFASRLTAITAQLDRIERALAELKGETGPAI